MEQNTPEWLEFRRNKIGASDCPIILGISPYKTPYQLWEEKVFGKEQQSNPAMIRGQMMEEQARQEFEKMTGIAVMPKVVVNPNRDWQMASLDGISFDGETFVEIKCPSEEIHQMAKEGRIPPHYYAQLQHQMCVIDAKQGYYFTFNGVNGALVPVSRDDCYIESILKQEEKFFECMTTKSAPALSDKDYVFRQDEAWKRAADELQEIRSCIKSFKEKEEKVEKLLFEMANGKSTKGGGVRVTRSICKGLIDYTEICKIYDIQAELYRKPSYEKWTISACK